MTKDESIWLHLRHKTLHSNHLSREFDQHLNSVAKCAKSLILGLPASPAHINLLDDDCKFEVGERHIKIHGGEVTRAFLRVDFHEGFSTDKTGQPRHGW